jgi:glycosyltransferase involved in cell wall biosynthesis
MSVRLYGRTVGNGSLAVVTRGFEQVLQGAGKLEAVFALDRTGGSDETSDGARGAQAKHGVFVGPLNDLRYLTQNARHEHLWVMVTPNSDYLPSQILSYIKQLQTVADVTIMSPSHWAANQVRAALANLCFGVDVVVVRHGVHAVLCPNPEEITKAKLAYDDGEFRVIHFSTTSGERKGTYELVLAWDQLQRQRRLPPAAKLILALDTQAKSALVERLLDAGLNALLSMPGLQIAPRPNLSPEQMRNVLCFMHVLCAPSRGEGFGLTPAEALACGVPVVATHVTGHSEGHCDSPGSLQVATGDLAPIDDGPGALAPSVSPEAIAETLLRAHERWAAWSEAALSSSSEYRKQWSWDAGLRDWLTKL